jgi:hypothetical protein
MVEQDPPKRIGEPRGDKSPHVLATAKTVCKHYGLTVGPARHGHVELSTSILATPAPKGDGSLRTQPVTCDVGLGSVLQHRPGEPVNHSAGLMALRAQGSRSTPAPRLSLLRSTRSSVERHYRRLRKCHHA